VTSETILLVLEMSLAPKPYFSFSLIHKKDAISHFNAKCDTSAE
jgi:hypothetical protein